MVVETLHATATAAMLAVVQRFINVFVILIVIVLAKIVVAVHLISVLDVDMLMCVAAASTCPKGLLK